MTRALQLQILVASALVVSLEGCVQLGGGGPGVEGRPAPLASAAVSVVDGLYNDAVAAIERRDYAQALELLQAARARAGDDVRVLNAFGVVYDELGRFDLSQRYYVQAQALDPTSRILAQNLAYSQTLEGRSSDLSKARSEASAAGGGGAATPPAVDLPSPGDLGVERTVAVQSPGPQSPAFPLARPEHVLARAAAAAAPPRASVRTPRPAAPVIEVAAVRAAPARRPLRIAAISQLASGFKALLRVARRLSPFDRPDRAAAVRIALPSHAADAPGPTPRDSQAGSGASVRVALPSYTHAPFSGPSGSAGFPWEE